MADGYAYAAIESVNYPYDPFWDDTGSGDDTSVFLPNLPKWPWPEPPYNTVTIPAPNPYPPTVEDDLDVNGDSYRFTHIVKSINQRLVSIGQSVSTLSTTQPDRQCDYTDINTARADIEGMVSSFRKQDDSTWANYNEVLDTADPTGKIYGKAAAAGGTTWTSLNQDGKTVEAKADMESTDVFTPFLFYQLEQALEELIYLPPTARWEAIVNSIDAKREAAGEAASGLDNTKADVDVVYTDINAARGFIEGLYDDFFVEDITSQSSYASGSYDLPGYTSYNNMLEEIGVGGDSPREWSNIDSGGSTVYRNDMLVDDQLTDLMYTEMETVLKALTETDSGDVGLAPNVSGTYSRTGNATPQADWPTAWANRGNISGSDFITTPVAYWKIDIYADGRYKLFGVFVNNIDVVVNQQYTINSPVANSRPRKHRLFRLAAQQAPAGYAFPYDSFGFGFGGGSALTHVLAEEDASFGTGTSSTLTWFNGTVKSILNWDEPPNVEDFPLPPSGSYSQFAGFREPYYFGSVKWQFSEDDLLGISQGGTQTYTEDANLGSWIDTVPL